MAREIDAQGCHVAIMAERIDGGCAPPRRGGGVWPRVERSGARGQIRRDHLILPPTGAEERRYSGRVQGPMVLCGMGLLLDGAVCVA